VVVGSNSQTFPSLSDGTGFLGSSIRGGHDQGETSGPELRNQSPGVSPSFYGHFFQIDEFFYPVGCDNNHKGACSVIDAF